MNIEIMLWASVNGGDSTYVEAVAEWGQPLLVWLNEVLCIACFLMLTTDADLGPCWGNDVDGRAQAH